MATTIGLVKSATETILGIGEVSIDNFTFKLFYKWSVSLFVAGSVAVCSSQFFGDPISCETADDSVDEEVLNAYCWMYSTFDIPPDFKIAEHSELEHSTASRSILGFFYYGGTPTRTSPRSSEAAA